MFPLYFISKSYVPVLVMSTFSVILLLPFSVPLDITALLSLFIISISPVFTGVPVCLSVIVTVIVVFCIVLFTSSALVCESLGVMFSVMFSVVVSYSSFSGIVTVILFSP